MWEWNKKIVITSHAKKQWDDRRHLNEIGQMQSLYKIAHSAMRVCSLALISEVNLSILKHRSDINPDKLLGYYDNLILVFSKNNDGSVALVTIMPFGRK